MTAEVNILSYSGLPTNQSTADTASSSTSNPPTSVEQFSSLLAELKKKQGNVEPGFNFTRQVGLDRHRPLDRPLPPPDDVVSRLAYDNLEAEFKQALDVIEAFLPKNYKEYEFRSDNFNAGKNLLLRHGR